MEKLTWKEFFTKMHEAAESNNFELNGVIVFKPESFDKEFSEKERSYKVSSGEKIFDSRMHGASMYGDCLDGSDRAVRLDWYMKALPEDGLGKRWKVDYCYIKDENDKEKKEEKTVQDSINDFQDFLETHTDPIGDAIKNREGKEYMGIKYISNEAEKCPVCGSDLYYDSVEHVDGDMEYYPWLCEKCNTKGEAWYKEVFQGHTVITPETDDNIDLPFEESKKIKTESIDYLKAAKQINDVSTEEIVNDLVKDNSCDKRLKDIAEKYKALAKLNTKLDDDKYIELDNEAEEIISELAGVDLLDLEENKKVESVDLYGNNKTNLEKGIADEVIYWLGELSGENGNDEIGKRAQEVLDNSEEVEKIVEKILDSDDLWEDLHLRIEDLAGIDYRNSSRVKNEDYTQASNAGAIKVDIMGQPIKKKNKKDKEDKALKSLPAQQVLIEGKEIKTEDVAINNGFNITNIKEVEDLADEIATKIKEENEKVTIDTVIKAIEGYNKSVFDVINEVDNDLYNKVDDKPENEDNRYEVENQFLGLVEDTLNNMRITVYDEYDESKKLQEDNLSNKDDLLFKVLEFLVKNNGSATVREIVDSGILSQNSNGDTDLEPLIWIMNKYEGNRFELSNIHTGDILDIELCLLLDEGVNEDVPGKKELVNKLSDNEYANLTEQMEKDIYRWLIDNYEIDLKDDMDSIYDVDSLIAEYRSAIFENYCDENELDLIWGYELDSNAPFGIKVFIDRA